MPLGALGGAGDTEAEPLASVVDHDRLHRSLCVARLLVFTGVQLERPAASGGICKWRSNPGF